MSTPEKRTFPAQLVLPPRTISGPGTAVRVVDECLVFGKRGVVVCGGSLQKHGALTEALDRHASSEGIVTFQHAGGEPTVAQLEALIDASRAHGAEWIAGVGGGSVMDLAKACAGLLNAPLPAIDYHKGEPIPVSRVPFIAVPTTAGTGSEATIVAVFTNSDTGTKKSIRHASFMPRLVILDADLLMTCPPRVIAHCGMDAFVQAVESYVSRGATWITEQLALKATRMIHETLLPMFDGGKPEEAQRLLEGSYIAGLALSNARLGLVHGLAHPLGARYHLAHGHVCAVCLPPVVSFNKNAMGDKYAALSNAVGGDFQKECETLLERLDIAPPFAGEEVIDRQGIIDETLASGSTAANPRDVSEADLIQIIEALFRS